MLAGLPPSHGEQHGSSGLASTPWFQGPVAVAAVLVVLAVGPRVLLLVGDQVAQGEAVVAVRGS